MMSQHNNFTLPYIVDQINSLNWKFSNWEYYIFNIGKKLERIEYSNAILKQDFEKISYKVE